MRLEDLSTAHPNIISLGCITPSTFSEQTLDEYLDRWLASSANAQAIPYITSRQALLTRPFASRPWARSAVVLSFLPEDDASSPLNALPAAILGRPFGIIAPYARHRDYHATGKDILERVIATLAKDNPEADFQTEACVDTHPVLEKVLAHYAGLGTLAPSSLIKDPYIGTSIHLAVLFTSRALPQTTMPLRNPLSPSAVPLQECQSCGRCLRICPNAAFSQTGDFAVTRCRAWLAGEYRGSFTKQHMTLLGNTLFGCGLCTSQCTPLAMPPLKIDALALFRLPTNQLNAAIRHTALEHSGATLLKRNAAAILATHLKQNEFEALFPELIQSPHSPVVKETLAATR